MRGLFGLGKKKDNREVQNQASQSTISNEVQKDESKYTVQYDRKTCIGAGVCAAVDGRHWEMVKDGKASLKGSSEKADKIFEREISESELAEVKKAAEGCPPSAIHIIKKDTGEKIV